MPGCWVQLARWISSTLGGPSGPAAPARSPAAPYFPQCRWPRAQITQPFPSPSAIGVPPGHPRPTIAQPLTCPTPPGPPAGNHRGAFYPAGRVEGTTFTTKGAGTLGGGWPVWWGHGEFDADRPDHQVPPAPDGAADPRAGPDRGDRGGTPVGPAHRADHDAPAAAGRRAGRAAPGRVGRPGQGAGGEGRRAADRAGPGPGAARGDPRVRRLGQAHRGVGGDLWRLLPRQRALLPGHRVRPDLPAAVRGPGADRDQRAELVLPRRAGQAGRGIPGRRPGRVQERGRAADRARVLRPGPGGAAAGGRLDRGATGRGDRAAAGRPGAGRPRPHRPRPVRGRRGTGHGPGGRARLSRRGLRGGPGGGRPGGVPAVPGPLPAGPDAGRAGQEAARPGRGRRRADLRDRADPARPHPPAARWAAARWGRTR